MRYLFFLVFICSVIQLNAQSTVESIPNQKLINGSYVSNPDGILSDAAVTQIDLIAQSIETRTSVQIAVVAVNSIGEQDVFDFAQALFSRWKIGHKENDNGLLIILVKDSHAIRFHTGKGLESTLPDITCKHIQRNFMVPAFKNGNYDAGVLAGMEEVERIITNPVYAQSLIAAGDWEESEDYGEFVLYLSLVGIPLLLVLFIIKAANARFADSKKMEPTAYPEMRSKRNHWLMEFAWIPALIVVIFWITPIGNSVLICVTVLYLYLMATMLRRLLLMTKVINRFLEKKSYYEIVGFLQKQQAVLLIAAIVFPMPFLFYFFYHLQRKKTYRTHPRACKQCGGNLIIQDEKNEDAFLSKSQQFEETLKAIDYDVWKCESCSKTEILNYVNRFSKYDVCISCKTKAKYLVSRGTVQEPTYTSTGTGEEISKCKFCNADYRSTYTIPMRTQASSSSSSSGSYESSSSSGGGSWGGGSSGGGGATSNW